MTVIHHVTDTAESRFTLCGLDAKARRMVARPRADATPERTAALFPGDRLCKRCGQTSRLREKAHQRRAEQGS